MATVNNAQLVAPTQMSASDAQIYLAAANTYAVVSRAIFSNPTTNPIAITVNITNGASNAANQIINARVVAAGETYVSPELAGAVIPPGSSIRGLAGTGSAIVVTISGVTVQ